MANLALIAAVIVTAAWVIRRLMLGFARGTPKLDYPVVGSPKDIEYSKAIIEGFKKYPDTPFIIPTKPEVVIMPMSVYMESKTHPSLSMTAETYERFMGRWTKLERRENHEIKITIRQDLTKAIASILPLIQDETKYAFDKELGHPEDWKPIPLYLTMLRMVSLLSGRVFVGSPLNRDEEWVDASINYTTAMASVMRDSATMNPFLVPFVAPFLPSVRRTKGYLRKAKKWMQPLVAELLSQEKEKSAPIKVGTRGTFIQWLLNYIPENQRTAEKIGTDQMLISFAAIHTTSSSGSMVLLDLATRPEYIDELREEIETVIAEDGEELDENGNSFIPKSTFAKMKKLDSFIKESQRWSGLGLITPARKVMEDLTFSNGMKIPKGARLAFPTYAINMSTDNKTMSPEYNAEAGNPGPEVFDGFRFSKLRELPGRESKHQSVTTGLDTLTFGHGPHACPGRFFAIYEIKSLLIEILRNYDFRVMGDVDGKGGDARRPPDMKIQMSRSPNPRAMLEIRKRRT